MHRVFHRSIDGSYQVWTEILSVLTVSMSAASLLIALRAAKDARVALEFAEASQRLPESRLRSLANTLDEHGELLNELANRVKMMRVRRAITHTDQTERTRDGLPDPHKDPDAWRKAMNERLSRTKLGLT